MEQDESPGRPNKYKKICQQLQDAIASGKYKKGQRIPSETQLSRMCGASRLTVGRALKELETLGVIDRRPGSGSYVREIPRSKGRTFGLLIPELGQTEIFEPICQGMARACRATHDELLWGAATSEVESHEQQAWQLCQHYISKNVSGVFFAPLEFTADRSVINSRIVEEFQRARIPVVLLDRDILEYPARSSCDLVGIDNRRAGHVVTDHLVKQGCERIVFLAWANSAPTVQQRIVGYNEAVRKADLPAFVEVSNPDSPDLISRLVLNIAPDGFICANDRTAGQLMIRLNELGIEIPSKVKIVGIDDAKYASFLHVPLTTLQQPCHDLGAAAMWTMMHRIEYPSMAARDVLLDCQLFIRRSCGSGRGSHLHDPRMS